MPENNPKKSIHDRPEPVEVQQPKMWIEVQKGNQFYKLNVPPEQAWLYSMLDDQNKTLKDIRSNTGWMLALIILTAIATFIGMF